MFIIEQISVEPQLMLTYGSAGPMPGPYGAPPGGMYPYPGQQPFSGAPGGAFM